MSPVDPARFKAPDLAANWLRIMYQKIKAHFVEPMLLHRAERLPEGEGRIYELKLDGSRAQAIKSGGRVQLRSRNDKDFNPTYPAIVQVLGPMPDETVVDGEIVAVDESGSRPTYRSMRSNLFRRNQWLIQTRSGGSPP
jgi:ATP-dependent DNA ligase